MNIRSRRFGCDLAIAVSLVATIVVLARFLSSDRIDVGNVTSSGSAETQASGPDIQKLKSAEGSFESALEIRENAQFLLSPALLIQQSIQSNKVISYPND